MFGGGGGAMGGQIADWIKSGADDTKRDQLTLYNMYESNRRENTRHSEWNTAMNFATDSYYNHYQNRVRDLQAAGINPMMAVMGQTGPGASVPGGGSPQSGQVGGQGGSHLSLASSAASAAQASLVSATAEKLQAEAANIRADTVVKQGQPEVQQAQVAQMKQSVVESVERAKLYMAQVGTEHATAAQRIEQANVLREQIPKIRETVALLRAQQMETLTRSGVNEHVAREILQRIEQNLPEIERAVAEMDQKLKSHQEVGARAQAFVDESFTGTVGRYLKALLPIGGIVGAIPTPRTIVQKAPPVHIHQPKGAY